MKNLSLDHTVLNLIAYFFEALTVHLRLRLKVIEAWKKYFNFDILTWNIYNSKFIDNQ